MQSHKLEFSNDVVYVIRDLCKQIFNAGSDEDIKRIFGIDNFQLEEIVKKIIDALPDYIFDKKYQRVLDEVKRICATEFVFFQVQEKWDDPHYQDDLSNFITVFSRDIRQQIDKDHTATIREE